MRNSAGNEGEVRPLLIRASGCRLITLSGLLAFHSRDGLLARQVAQARHRINLSNHRELGEAGLKRSEALGNLTSASSTAST